MILFDEMERLMGMQISLDKPDLEHFVQQQIKLGHYKNAEEVVRGALSLLQAHEDLSPEELAHLRKEIAAGIEQSNRGESRPWDRDEIAAEVERRHAAARRSV